MDTLCKKLLWVALALLIGTSVTAQEKVSKKIAETYALSQTGKVHLENKYGNIHVNGWAKDEVSVEIIITTNHRKRENAEDLLKRITPIIRENDGFLSIKYQIAEKSQGWFAKLIDETNPFDFNKSNLQIDFIVYMPAKATLNVTNTFGDVIIDDWTGNLKATIEHGDIWINESLNKANVFLKYGKLRAKNINYGALELKNGELDMQDAKSLRITSSGTDIELATINSLEIYSNKDDIVLEEVNTVFGNLKFSTLAAERLTKDVDMTLRIADFRVAKIMNPKVSIAIEQESSAISINVTNFSHQFDATLEQGLVRLPKSFENIDSKMLDKSKKLREISAQYGNDIQGRISITGKKGIVQLNEE